MEHQVLQFVIYRNTGNHVVGQAVILPDGSLTGNIDINLVKQIDSRIGISIDGNFVVHENKFPSDEDIKIQVDDSNKDFFYPKFVEPYNDLPRRIPMSHILREEIVEHVTKDSPSPEEDGDYKDWLRTKESLVVLKEIQTTLRQFYRLVNKLATTQKRANEDQQAQYREVRTDPGDRGGYGHSDGELSPG